MWGRKIFSVRRILSLLAVRGVTGVTGCCVAIVVVFSPGILGLFLSTRRCFFFVGFCVQHPWPLGHCYGCGCVLGAWVEAVLVLTSSRVVVLEGLGAHPKQRPSGSDCARNSAPAATLQPKLMHPCVCPLHPMTSTCHHYISEMETEAEADTEGDRQTLGISMKPTFGICCQLGD